MFKFSDSSVICRARQSPYGGLSHLGIAFSILKFPFRILFVFYFLPNENCLFSFSVLSFIPHEKNYNSSFKALFFQLNYFKTNWIFFFMLLLFAFTLRVHRSNQWDEWVVVGFCRQPRTGSLMLSFFNICAKGPKGGESVYSCHTEV